MELHYFVPISLSLPSITYLRDPFCNSCNATNVIPLLILTPVLMTLRTVTAGSSTKEATSPTYGINITVSRMSTIASVRCINFVILSPTVTISSPKWTVLSRGLVTFLIHVSRELDFCDTPARSVISSLVLGNSAGLIEPCESAGK